MNFSLRHSPGLDCRRAFIGMMAIVVVGVLGASAETDFVVPPGSTSTIYVDANENWGFATAMSVRLETTAKPKENSSVRVMLVDKSGFWYQSKAATMLSDDETTVELSFEGPEDWEAHRKLRRPFGRDSLRWIRRWGVEIVNDDPSEALTGRVLMVLQNGDLENHGSSVLRYPVEGIVGRLAEFSFEDLAMSPESGRRLSLAWEAGEAKGVADFFPMQRFARVKPPFGEAELRPVGRSVWAARWRPPVAGAYKLTILRDGKPDDAMAALRSFEVSEAGPAAAKPADAGTGEGFVRRAQRVVDDWRDDAWNRMTVGEVPCWQAQLEWTADWGEYLGAGEYHQRLAWELEEAIAAHEGPAMPILVFADDELDKEGVYNWAENPLNQANGGPLSRPGELYHSGAGMEAMLNRARYVLRRYGALPKANGILLDVRHPATHGKQWAAEFARRVLAEFPGTPIFFATMPSPQVTWSMAATCGEDWQEASSLGEGTTTVVAGTEPGRVTVRGSGPGATAVIRRRVAHLAHAAALSFTVDPKGESADAMQVMVVLKSVDGKICQSPLLRLWGEFSHRLQVPLDDLSFWLDGDGKPALQQRSDLAAMEEVALRFFCEPAPAIELSLGDLALHGREGGPVLGPFDAVWEDALWVRQGGDWQEVAESADRAWRVLLDWQVGEGASGGYGQRFDEGIAGEFERALRAHGGKPQPIVLFSEDELDWDSLYNWPDHPLNAANGGPMSGSGDFYRNKQVFEAMLGRARFLLKRYGELPAVDGLLVDLRYRHDGSEAWVNRLVEQVAKEFPGVSVYCNSENLPKRSWQQGINLAYGWRLAPELGQVFPGHNGPSAEVRRRTSIGGKQKRPRVVAASLATRGMKSAALVNRYVLHWAHASSFTCSVKPSGNCRDVRVTATLRTDDGRLFESPLIRTYGGYRHRLDFPLDEPGYWIPRNGDRQLIPELDLLNVHEVVLRFFNLPASATEIEVADTRLLGAESQVAAAQAEFAITDLSGNAESCRQFGRFELDFQLNRNYRNPYDPSEARVDLYLIAPDGTKFSHPGFYWEDWSLALKEGVETVTKGQRSAWKVRFTPQQVGTYNWVLEAKGRGEVVQQKGSFTSTPGSSKGFVVVSKKDPRYFEFSNGDFFYPIGHNLRSPSDRREGAYSSDVLENCAWAERAGTFAFEKWFAKMAANGENFARTWMTAWWLGLEWSPEYPGFHGLGFYNQANSSRLDRVLELAETHGVYLNLELMNHGALSSKVDSEWALNPLNRTRPGGFMRTPAETLTSERARDLQMQRLRYVAARWGHSTAIAFWGTVTEAEWADAYGADRSGYARWLDRYGHDVQRFNGAHPQAVTTHFSYPDKAGSVWERPHLQITHTNAYDTMHDTGWQAELFRKDKGIADRMYVFGKGLESYKQPLLVGEWGGNHLVNDTNHLVAELHTGLWASYMTNASGATGFWWWNLVDHKDLYDRFKGLANYARNEDRRGKNYVSLRGRVLIRSTSDASIRPRAMTLHNPRELFAYVYTPGVNRYKESIFTTSRTDERLALVPKSALLVPESFEAGACRVEFWDTYSGTVISTEEITITAEKRMVPLPPFSTDLAIKLRRIE